MPELILCLLIAAGLGYLAQTTGLCMVRGMTEWMVEGAPEVFEPRTAHPLL